MSNIEHRIKEIDRKVQILGKGQQVRLFIVHNEDQSDEAAKAQAIAEYIKDHPDWQDENIIVMCVANEETEQLVERLIAGEPWKVTNE